MKGRECAITQEKARGEKCEWSNFARSASEKPPDDPTRTQSTTNKGISFTMSKKGVQRRVGE